MEPDRPLHRVKLPEFEVEVNWDLLQAFKWHLTGMSLELTGDLKESHDRIVRELAEVFINGRYSDTLKRELLVFLLERHGVDSGFGGFVDNGVFTRWEERGTIEVGPGKGE